MVDIFQKLKCSMSLKLHFMDSNTSLKILKTTVKNRVKGSIKILR